MKRFKTIQVIVVVLALVVTTAPAFAVAKISPANTSQSPAQSAETLRTQLFQTQMTLKLDVSKAATLFVASEQIYNDVFAPEFRAIANEVDAQAQRHFAEAKHALDARDETAFAAARASIWTAVLNGSYRLTEAAVNKGDGDTARQWLGVREFRRATRFSRPNTDATLAIEDLGAGKLTPQAASAAVQADLLDTYQARLSEALSAAKAAEKNNFAVRRAEYMALAAGYFEVLAPAYRQQRGDAALVEIRQQWIDLSDAAAGEKAFAQIDAALGNFRAAPLSPAEQVRRAGQMLRFLALVPVEYGRGVSNGVVKLDLEIREAISFYEGASAAFADLRALLEVRDGASVAQANTQLQTLNGILADAAARRAVADPEQVRMLAEGVIALMKQTMPEAWLKQDSNADFDVIATALDQMESAVAAGEYALAESARLEAYAILESGPEARLTAFAPQHVLPIEDMFWYGQGDQAGLALLIQQQASAKQVKSARNILQAELAAAQKALSGNTAPEAVATNAGIIVVREGLEAVLILAALMASFKGATAKYRRPMWLGAGLAIVASLATWAVMQGALTLLGQYGEKLEAVVSLVAIGVLLLITNWFFHDVYWTGWNKKFHQQKKGMLDSNTGRLLGLVTLGFTSVYREGFETALFMQSLILEGGWVTVAMGAAIGFALVCGVGLLIFKLHARLPVMKMLIVTGIMIGAVLLVMVGNTVHIMQTVGWLSITPIRWLQLPYWSGLWLGTFATVEGIGLQLISAAFVLGSYFVAQWAQRKNLAKIKTRSTTMPSISQ